MYYVVLTLLFIALTFVIYKFGKSGRKEFQPKLSHRERAELENKIEKDIPESSPKPVQEKQKYSLKTALPSKNITDEINRFKTFYDIENDKLTQFIRNGIQKCKNQNNRSALEDFSHAVELKPLEPIGHYCRGLTKLLLKNFESAVSDFTEAIRLQMREANVSYYRGLANYEARDYDHAILDFEGYVKAENNFAEAYFNLALCYKQKKDYQKAILYFSETINKNPRHEVAYFERALLKDKVGDKEDCIKDLKKAMEMGHLEAYHYIKELSGVKS
jgi:tetratricopeptide (TPR) repeat protein